MPYIKLHRRHELLNAGELPETAGELNYILSMVVLGYALRHGLDYQRINDIVGALDGAKVEFQRRVVTPFENAKMNENGDVYPANIPIYGALGTLSNPEAPPTEVVLGAARTASDVANDRVEAVMGMEKEFLEPLDAIVKALPKTEPKAVLGEPTERTTILSDAPTPLLSAARVPPVAVPSEEEDRWNGEGGHPTPPVAVPSEDEDKFVAGGRPRTTPFVQPRGDEA